MEKKNTKSKIQKICYISGILLLVVMALFHGSGFWYVKGVVQASNAERFLKDIVPVLFAHPSVHLFGLAAFGVLGYVMGETAKKMTYLLAGLILIDALLAFLLGGILPGVLLLIAAFCFVFASRSQ